MSGSTIIWIIVGVWLIIGLLVALGIFGILPANRRKGPGLETPSTPEEEPILEEMRTF